MEYNVIKDADKILARSNYVVQNPKNYKNKWHELFKNNNPIHLELGMGRGEFIITMAKQNPRINFIGLELNESQTAYAVQRINNQNIPNLKLICANANDLLEFFGKEIDTIYLTFSEPWPKPIDEKKRFTHVNYLKMYDRIYKKDKHLILKTDNKVLFSYSLESLSSYWYEFKRVSVDLHHDERNIPNVMTDWEQKCFKDGKQIYYVEAYFNN
ncbi:MAG: tRNA (guanosine(46)-N7)-methyltransferase TrmB [Bacilli bacterium]|nr:tRNA (guanosine(46)-N7)-methyltransferase TrmB [Bacilli bacterium]